MIASSTLAGILAIPAGFKVNQRVFNCFRNWDMIFNVKMSVGVGTGSCLYGAWHVLQQNDGVIVIVKI